MHTTLRQHPSWAFVIALFGFAAGCASTAPIAQASFAVNGGQEDHNNRYLSTMWVSTTVGNCSGVLISPRVVLSSAHCFCLPSDFKSRPGTQIYTSASCQSEARVTRYRYQYDAKDGWVEEPLSHKGRIVAHPDFRSEVLDGKLKSHLADLAVIHLEKAFEDVTPESVAENDVRRDERLVLVGLGPSNPGDTDDGVRRFGKNLVTEVVDTQEAQEFRFRTGGVHILEGDSGGPCFRETSAGRWLVGISGGFVVAGQDSWFTSTFYYRNWIERQKRQIPHN